MSIAPCQDASIPRLAHQTSPNWVKPNDLMKKRKLKARRQALQNRFNSSIVQTQTQGFSSEVKDEASSHSQIWKRSNPFKCSQSKSQKLDVGNDSSENSSDGSLFHFFDNRLTVKQEDTKRPCNFNVSLPEKQWTESSVIQETLDKKGLHHLPFDWSLKSRIRFCSSKPIPWKQTFKTSEEASGTTGFVRCLSSKTEENSRSLDTSTNAEFYQCCLYWQHPSLPFVSLFPRDRQKISAQMGLFGSNPKIISSLHADWSESLRSLYQLLRVRQCPFFYMSSHKFTCLFRAAGAAGFPHTHALIFPTTRGFRDSMKQEGIEFSLPLLDKLNQSKSEASEESLRKCEAEAHITNVEDDEDDEHSEFLEELGLETSHFPTLNQNKVENKKLQDIDGSPDSMVYVRDSELQALINFILNSSSCTTTTGALAGIPPTLLSPVGFKGGTLKSLKIGAGTVRTLKGEILNSIDLQGPILPSTVLSLSSLLASSSDSYSASLFPLDSTIPFSAASPSFVGSSMPMAFANEGLVDCGLEKDIRAVMCKSIDELKLLGIPSNYKDFKYENMVYTCHN